MKSTGLYIVVLCCVALWCAMLFVPPLAASVAPSSTFSQQLYAWYSPICHQYESRSFHILDHKLAVCSRCSSIYLGFLIGCLLAPLVARKWHVQNRWILLAAVAPIVVDVVLDLLGIHPSSFVTRIVTGSLFGILAGVNLVPTLVEALSTISFHPFQGVQHESKAG